MEELLKITNLRVHYETDDEVVQAVNGVTLSLAKGGALGLVGETGAGKTTTALSILQLIPSPPGEIVDGEIIFNNKNIFAMSESRRRNIRGNEISMIFQDPMTALNPVFTVGEQIAESIMIHQGKTARQAKEQTLEMLKTVDIEPRRYDDYPHQFSGGMKQRVIIAMALACNPNLLIADEPTTALDVTIQAQALELINHLRKKYQTALLLITHDLGVVAETCENVAIMYAGQIVEYGAVGDVYRNVKHPYTQALFGSIPKIEQEVEFLKQIQKLPPNPANLPTGCSFHPRCDYARSLCAETPPRLSGADHQVMCHFPITDTTDGQENKES